MSAHNTSQRWGWVAKTLHWVMAVLIIGLAIVGTIMANFLNDMALQFELTQQHKSFGFVVFTLALIRIAWRWFSPAVPREPEGQPVWERVASHVTHYGLYALMLIMPLSGWMMSTSSPLNDPGAYPTQVKNMVFGIFELPDPVHPANETLEKAFHMIHAYSSYLLAALLILHIAGAMKHHFILRDTTLRRMLPLSKVGK